MNGIANTMVLAGLAMLFVGGFGGSMVGIVHEWRRGDRKWAAFWAWMLMVGLLLWGSLAVRVVARIGAC